MYKCSIIANPEGNAWDFACFIYKILRARNEKFELNKVLIQKFRDGEIKPKIEKNVRRRNCFFIHDSSLSPADWFLQLSLINEILHNSSAQEITDVLPYLKFGRQDRKDESRVPISSKVVAKLIEKDANRVLTMDVHSPSIGGFYNVPFDNLHSFLTIVDYLKKNYPGFFENMVIMSPDVGGAKRARSFAKRAGISRMAVGDKNREEDGEVEKIHVIGEVEGRDVFIVDDIIDSGNTLIQACNAVRAMGARKVYAYATHGLFTEGTERLTKCFDSIFVGDTFPNTNLKDEKIKVVSFAPLFAEAIYRINEGESLSALFD
jgi:ribose-phosphate pyrophosphokinase